MNARRLRIPAPDRRRQILEAATGLFARQGFKGTTTRQVADRAGVTEALIFRHFPKKEDLYWAIIDGKCESGSAFERLSAGPSPSGDRALFASVAEAVLNRHAEDPHLQRLVLWSALENHRLSRRFFDTYIARRHQALAEHIREKIRRGQFRKVDPLLAARSFIGMVLHHVQVQELFGEKRRLKFDSRLVAETLADIWLSGMCSVNSDKKSR